MRSEKRETVGSGHASNNYLLLVNRLATRKALVGFAATLTSPSTEKYIQRSPVSRERKRARKETNHSYPLRLGPRHGVHLDATVPVLQIPFRVLDHSRPAQSSTFEPVGLDAPLMQRLGDGVRPS